jgi:hypothetical protein
MGLQDFSTWLAATPASLFIQATDAIVPAVQTIHILCIAVVVSGVLLVHLSTLGIAMRSQSGAALARRFFPWLWWALLLLLLTGAVLITAEPGRSLTNWVFQLKMLLVISAVVLTLLFQRPLRKDPDYWQRSAARRTGAGAIAIASLGVWVGVVFAGRWIAYAIEN